MVTHFTRARIILEIKGAISNSPYVCKWKGHGRAGNLLEEILGIDGGNYDVADAVGFELKTTMTPNTPTTLFHKDPKPRGTKQNLSATAFLVDNFGWPSIYQKTQEPVKSFRATIYGKWKSTHKNQELIISANNNRVSIIHNDKEVAYWDSNDLATTAASKLRNMMYVEAQKRPDNQISFVNALLFEEFQPFKFIAAIENGDIAIDFDARTNPGKSSIRNHGTKFRIKERDMMLIYNKVTPIDLL